MICLNSSKLNFMVGQFLHANLETFHSSFFLSFFLYSQHMRSHPNEGYYPRSMHQHNATQGAGARDKGAQECDQLKDEREHELQDTTVGFEATEVTYSHILKTQDHWQTIKPNTYDTRTAHYQHIRKIEHLVSSSSLVPPTLLSTRKRPISMMISDVRGWEHQRT